MPRVRTSRLDLRPHRWLPVVAAVAIAPFAGAALGAGYAVTSLGSVRATAMNASGQVVGYRYQASDDRLHAFLYSAGAMIDVGGPPGTDSIATAINDLGWVVGYSQTRDGAFRRNVFLYGNGVTRDLGTFCEPDGVASPTGMNDNGQIVGHCDYYFANSSINRAFLFGGGSIADLGLDPTLPSEALGINAGGQVVGAAASAHAYRRAFLFDAGTLIDLPTPGGASASAYAYAINASGQVAGTMRMAGARQWRAFLYSGGAMRDLGTMPTLDGRPVEFDYFATAINSAGQVVGAASHTSGLGLVIEHGWVHADGTMRELASFMEPGSAWSFEDPVGIDNVGQIVVNGCGPAGCGAFLLSPRATTFRNYQGIWWNAPAGSESGWGINLAHQGDTLFATWFTYDAAGKPWWLSMTAHEIAKDAYAGTLYGTTGPPFDAATFDPAKVTRTPLGVGTLTFADGDNGMFAYTIGDVSRTKSITRQVFGPQPVCAYGSAPSFAPAANYQDLWWSAGGTESGWGLNLAHQGDIVFATWFTYGADGMPLWLTVTATKTGAGVYGGQLVSTMGPALGESPFDPDRVTRTVVGTASLAFANGNAATFTHTINGVTRAKFITRQLFAPPAGTVCR